MLLVKTYLDKSKLHGIGLFAGQDIQKGQITWRFTSGFDSAFEPEEVEGMPALLREFIETYASLSTRSGLYILGNDNVRFTNHSNKPNLVAKKIEEDVELAAVALRDIKKDEEMTIDYKTFDKLSLESRSKYLSS